ncbi:MAG: hypothetical protein JSW44_01260 [Candidatus Bathyarchaeota archaeon]|nr:MAG: hypothetical protein JSW44_01260 [Candidatus Bathyarchaeota archaeon]
MQSNKKQKKFGKEKLQRIIEMCMAIENHTVDPFLLDVDNIIRVVKEYFPQWEQAEELNMDSEAIHHLASVIKLQSEWIKYRSTSLYTDPFLLEEKIMQTGKEEMIRVFLKAWHPLVELEQLSLHSLAGAIRYWETLVPLKERWPELAVPEVSMGIASRGELIKQCILGDKVFSEELNRYWQELNEKVEEKGHEDKILYWDFIGAETYEETVQRALIASFLITYGYATLKIYPLREEIFIKPFEKPSTKIGTQQSISIPIAVTYETWQKWKRGELD